MTVRKAGKLALLWRGDRQARGESTAQNINRVFEALTALGIRAEPAIYADEMADDVREQLLKLDGVLVWVDPVRVCGRRNSFRRLRTRRQSFACCMRAAAAYPKRCRSATS